MLLQTVKSRNLWLWGEILKEEKNISYKSYLLSERELLLQKLSSAKEELLDLNSMGQGESIRAKEVQETESELEAKLKELELKIKEAEKSSITTKPTVLRTYTDPFKITALQSIDVTWDNPIGESYGITSNFLQSWHNKPVNISFKGISYMGAFGGKTVGNLGNDETVGIAKTANAFMSKVTGSINTFTDKIQNVVNQKLSGLESEGKFEPVVDEDIKNISDLLSNYGEGPFTRNVTNTSPYIYLLMENSGGANTGDGFVTFIGHIKNFTYSERSDKPFLYDYTVQFVGESAINVRTSKATIDAKNDSSNVRLTVITSDSGYSLGYGW